MKYETILFDLDGTLLYTVRDLAGAVNHALEKHGFPAHSEERIERMVGNGVRTLVARALPRGLDTPGFEEILADFRAYYSAHCGDNTHPYPGVVELLLKLKARSCRTAVVTNKYQAAAEDLVRRFFGDSVDVVIGDARGGGASRSRTPRSRRWRRWAPKRAARCMSVTRKLTGRRRKTPACPLSACPGATAVLKSFRPWRCRSSPGTRGSCWRCYDTFS